MIPDLDEIDRQIVYCLSKLKCSLSDIAGELGIGLATIRERVKKLKKRNIIQGLKYEINPKHNIGCTAFVFITLETDYQYRNILPRLEDIKGIVECHFLSGEYTMLCKIYAIDNSGLMGIVRQLQEIEYIVDMRFFISLNEGFKYKFK